MLSYLGLELTPIKGSGIGATRIVCLADTPHKTRYTPLPHVNDATTRLDVPHVILRRYAIFAEQMA